MSPAVFDPRHDLLFGRLVAAQLIRDDHPRHVSQPLQQLTKEFLSCLLISAALDQNVEHLALLVHGSPQVMKVTVDPVEVFVQVPPVTRSRAPAAQVVGVGLAELQAPFTNDLVGEGDAAHSDNLFNIMVAVSEAEV